MTTFSKESQNRDTYVQEIGDQPVAEGLCWSFVLINCHENLTNIGRISGLVPGELVLGLSRRNLEYIKLPSAKGLAGIYEQQRAFHNSFFQIVIVSIGSQANDLAIRNSTPCIGLPAEDCFRSSSLPTMGAFSIVTEIC